MPGHAQPGRGRGGRPRRGGARGARWRTLGPSAAGLGGVFASPASTRCCGCCSEADSPVEAIVAYASGQPVATAQVFFHGVTAYVGWVATTAAAMRGGLGTLVTRDVIARACLHGASTVSLIASPMGAPVYRRIGFSDVAWLRSAVQRVPGAVARLTSTQNDATRRSVGPPRSAHPRPFRKPFDQSRVLAVLAFPDPEPDVSEAASAWSLTTAVRRGTYAKSAAIGSSMSIGVMSPLSINPGARSASKAIASAYTRAATPMILASASP